MDARKRLSETIGETGKMKNLRFCFFLLLITGLLSVTGFTEQDTSKEKALEKIRILHAKLKLAPRDSYLNYAIATIAERNEIDLEKNDIAFPLFPIVTDDPARRVDLFRLTTGATALHESLQLSELLTVRRATSNDTVSIADLGAPELSSLDFLKRLEEENGVPILDEESHLFPLDWLYLRFRTGADLMDFLDEADMWNRHILTYYGSGARNKDLVWRLFDKLGMPDPRKFRKFYEAIPGAISLGMSDIFVNEGSDITILLPKGTPSFLFTESGSRHSGEVDGRVFLSTSKPALDKVLSLSEKKSEALGTQPDYQYMRSKLPAREDEAVFIYLSEAFLHKLVGPRLRILESRRIRCASHMRTVINASLLFLEEQGRQPETILELVENRYLKAGRGFQRGSNGIPTFCKIVHQLLAAIF